MDDATRQLRYEVVNFFLKDCRPPTIQDLVDKDLGDEASIVRGLQKLEELHHLKLYYDGVPSPTPITMVHPFSHLPSPNLVTSRTKSWWTNCAWCAFGLASMLSPDDATVHVLTASGECIHVPVINDRIADEKALQNYYAIFSAPPSQWWKDVRFACSSIQICTSREEADNWHKKHGFPPGDIISLDQLWRLSKVWYHDKPSYEYERKSETEKEQLFEGIGLVSSYWST